MIVTFAIQRCWMTRSGASVTRPQTRAFQTLQMDGEDRGIGIMNKMWKRVLKGLLFSVLKPGMHGISLMGSVSAAF